jgi:DNA-binding LacI/PurR family transcriptional regulator
MGTGDDAQSRSAVPTVRTLADLARLAGVSAGTVSRALAGKSLVNAETRDRIQALAREHGFRPNQMASKLRSGRTGAIGVVIPLGHAVRQHISDPFFLTLLGGLADELTENGYDLMLRRAIPDGTSDWLEDMTGSGMVDGVLLIGQSDQSDVIDRVAETYRPLVAWGACRPDQVHCAVGTDNVLGGSMAARHLIERGARKLAFLGITTGIEIEKRFRGATEAANEAGVPLIHLPVSFAVDEMAEQIRDVLAQHGADIDGIIAGSDVIALNAVSILQEQGRRVPDDVQVIGFDDLPLAAIAVPPLSTIRQEIATGAREMVAKLKARIGGEEAPSLTMPPQLIERGTTRKG